MSEITVTDSNFEEIVLKAKTPVLVDFWAVWCGPCQMQNPILEDIAKEYEGKATVCKINVDENQVTAAKYGVMSIPTLMLFNQGQLVKQMVGVQSKEVLVEELNLLLK
jgi:thioredoxin 1